MSEHISLYRGSSLTVDDRGVAIIKLMVDARALHPAMLLFAVAHELAARLGLTLSDVEMQGDATRRMVIARARSWLPPLSFEITEEGPVVRLTDTGNVLFEQAIGETEQCFDAMAGDTRFTVRFSTEESPTAIAVAA